jgi:ABC-type ATPase involved in cell division
VKRSPRVLQLEGLFDVPPTTRSSQSWKIDLPIEDGKPWNIGLIVGPSGSGKSTVARSAFADHLVEGYHWPADKSIVDAFPAKMGIKEIVGALSSVGFSSPPAWLRPFACLSNGEQFRATMARALAESPDLCVMDEFTSVVDRTVAQVGSAAIAKSVRRAGKQFIAVTCHFDVLDWLQPDWVLEMPLGTFTRRLLRRRPKIRLTIARVHRSSWQLFKHHHYLDTSIAPTSRSFVAFVGERPVAFTAVVHAMGKANYWREHRTVCLPDFQGVGIGNALSEYVASLFQATGKAYASTTSSPSMIGHRARSPLWLLTRKPGLAGRDTSEKKRTSGRTGGWPIHRATTRLTAGFRYVGPARLEEARRFGLI